MSRSSAACLFLGSLLMFSVSCTQYKPYSVRNNTSTPSSTQNLDLGSPVSMNLVIDNTKLAAEGALQAKITYGATVLNQNFTPTGAQTTLSGISLPSGVSMLKIEISKDNVLKYVAKKSNAKVASGVSVVVDDCLILRAPWTGIANEGSCEWNITEVAN